MTGWNAEDTLDIYDYMARVHHYPAIPKRALVWGMQTLC